MIIFVFLNETCCLKVFKLLYWVTLECTFTLISSLKNFNFVAFWAVAINHLNLNPSNYLLLQLRKTFVKLKLIASRQLNCNNMLQLTINYIQVLIFFREKSFFISDECKFFFCFWFTSCRIRKRQMFLWKFIDSF